MTTKLSERKLARVILRAVAAGDYEAADELRGHLRRLVAETSSFTPCGNCPQPRACRDTTRTDEVCRGYGVSPDRTDGTGRAQTGLVASCWQASPEVADKRRQERLERIGTEILDVLARWLEADASGDAAEKARLEAEHVRLETLRWEIEHESAQGSEGAKGRGRAVS